MDIYVDKLVQVWDDGGDGIVALDGISHHFGSGKLTCLLGPSGCGKSTLVQIIGGIEKATGGSIRITDPSQPSAPSARPGERSVIMQDYWSGYYDYVEKKVSAERLFETSIAKEALKRLETEKPFGK